MSVAAHVMAGMRVGPGGLCPLSAAAAAAVAARHAFAACHPALGVASAAIRHCVTRMGILPLLPRQRAVTCMGALRRLGRVRRMP